MNKEEIKELQKLLEEHFELKELKDWDWRLEQIENWVDSKLHAQKEEIRENGLKEMVKHKIITSKRAKELKKLIK